MTGFSRLWAIPAVIGYRIASVEDHARLQAGQAKRKTGKAKAGKTEPDSEADYLTDGGNEDAAAAAAVPHTDDAHDADGDASTVEVDCSATDSWTFGLAYKTGLVNAQCVNHANPFQSQQFCDPFAGGGMGCVPKIAPGESCEHVDPALNGVVCAAERHSDPNVDTEITAACTWPGVNKALGCFMPHVCLKIGEVRSCQSVDKCGPDGCAGHNWAMSGEPATIFKPEHEHCAHPFCEGEKCMVTCEDGSEHEVDGDKPACIKIAEVFEKHPEHRENAIPASVYPEAMDKLDSMAWVKEGVCAEPVEKPEPPAPKPEPVEEPAAVATGAPPKQAPAPPKEVAKNAPQLPTEQVPEPAVAPPQEPKKKAVKPSAPAASAGAAETGSPDNEPPQRLKDNNMAMKTSTGF